MRRNRTGTRARLRRLPTARGLGLAGALAAVLAFAPTLTTQALGQGAGAPAKKAADATPAPPDDRPMARYVPGDKLVMLIESNGLDLHSEGWAKTAAFKMLNETTLGEMLEAMSSQLADRALASKPGKKMSGADVTLMAKHALKHGFVFSVGMRSAQVTAGGSTAKEDTGTAFLVVRGAATRESRAPFSRLIGTMMGDAKQQVVKKGNRMIVGLPNATGKAPGWVWWSEGNDLVIGTPGTEDVVPEVLDGKRPSAVDHPVRSELSQSVDGLTPVVTMFVDPTVVPKAPPGAPGMHVFINKVAEVVGVKRIDYRWGFQDDALMSVTKIHATKPRKNLLAVFDQPSFDRSKLPPIPEGLESFTVVSVDSVKALDFLLGALSVAPGAIQEKVTSTIDSLKTKSRIDLRKDLLARMGPKMAIYVMPGSATASTRAGGESAAGGEGAAAAAPASGLGTIPGLSTLLGGSVQVPRAVLVAEIDNKDAFGKSLDNLMLALNREFKAQAADAADGAAAAAAPGAPGAGRPGTGARRGGGRAEGPGGGGAMADEGGDAAGKRRGPPPAPEFKLMPGKDKVYQLNIPAGMSRQIPPGLRPTVRLGDKYLVIAATPDAARLAMELKPGAWTAPPDLAPTLDRLPRTVTYLSVDDPRPSLPDVLASLPATLQRAVNTAIVAGQARMAAAAAGAGASAGPGAPATAGPAGEPTAGAGGGSLRGYRGGAGGPQGTSGASGPTGGASYPGAAAYAGGAGGGSSGGPMPGGPGQAQAPGSEAAAQPSTLTFEIDPSKLPKADDLRSKMFPGATAVSVDDQQITIVSRGSFPNVVSPAAAIGVALAMPAIQSARTAAARAAGATPGAVPPAASAPGVPGAPAEPGAAAPGRPGGARGKFSAPGGERDR